MHVVAGSAALPSWIVLPSKNHAPSGFFTTNCTTPPTSAASPGVFSSVSFALAKIAFALGSVFAAAGAAAPGAAGAAPGAAPPCAARYALAAAAASIFFKNSSFCAAITLPEILSLPPK